MPMPLETVTGTTATGDVNVGPGVPNFIVKGMPVTCIGDAVTGPVCVGAITFGAVKFIVKGRPSAMITGQVAGVNPATGVPVASVELGTGALTFIIT